MHPIPVFCALDDIEVQANCLNLGDLNFVTKKAKNFVLQLGYTGPGWQHRVLTEWLLNAGVICWADISHTLTATAHHPADILTQPLRVMEAAWEGAVHGSEVLTVSWASGVSTRPSCINTSAPTMTATPRRER